MRRIGRFASTTLAGRSLTVPDDLDRPTLLVFAYRQRQQRVVDTWLAAVPDDADADVLEVPVLARRWRPARRLIDGGMASNMDRTTRERTMCVYTNPTTFRRRVLHTTSLAVLALVVDAEGIERWRATGRATPGAVDDLLDALTG